MRRWALSIVGALALVLAGIGGARLHGPAVRQIASSTSGLVAVVYSGDGGWTRLDDSLAQALARDGVGVVGVDSLKYFWRARTPQGAADDLAALLAAPGGGDPASRIVLVGYSFGADALPVIVQRLPPDLRRRIAALVLIAPETLGELNVRPGAWLGLHPPDAYPVAPVVAALSDVPITCIYGLAERRDACPTFGPEVRKIALPGGHHFAGDRAAAGRALADAIRPAWR